MTRKFKKHLDKYSVIRLVIGAILMFFVASPFVAIAVFFIEQL